MKRKGTWKVGHLKGRALGKEVGKGGESFWKGGVLLERKDSSWRKADLSGNNDLRWQGETVGRGGVEEFFLEL